MTACPRCGAANEAGSAYCYSCGVPLDGETRPLTRRSARNTAAPVGHPGGFWLRLFAHAIDGFLIFLITGAVAARQFVFAAPTWEEALFTMPFSLWGGLYYTVAIGLWRTTIGKRVFGLYVVRTDGSRVGILRALARWLCYFISAFILFIGFLIIAFNRDKRGLHDFICDTQVVRS
jgi:uncharacterized RDD family membrane protein YckC